MRSHELRDILKWFWYVNPNHLSGNPCEGFDDIISAAYQKPSLTTVRQPLRKMGSEGAQILLDLIADPKKEQPSEIVMQPELIVRESTGPAPTTASARKKS